MVTSPEKQFLTKITDRYGPNWVGPGSFCLWSNDYEIQGVYPFMACHEILASRPPGIDVIVTAVPWSDELSLKYLNWLIGGPFRAYQDKISLEEFKPGKYVIRITETDKWPANVLYNFCIATRVPIEYKAVLADWDEITNNGIEPALAFYLANYGYNGMDKPINLAGLMGAHHFWFDPSADIRNLVSGTMDKKWVAEKSYKENPHACKPTNKIWGILSQTDRQQMAGKKPAELMDVFGLNPPVVPEEPETPKKPFTFEEIILNNPAAVQDNAVQVLQQFNQEWAIDV